MGKTFRHIPVREGRAAFSVQFDADECISSMTIHAFAGGGDGVDQLDWLAEACHQVLGHLETANAADLPAADGAHARLQQWDNMFTPHRALRLAREAQRVAAIKAAGGVREWYANLMGNKA